MIDVVYPYLLKKQAYIIPLNKAKLAAYICTFESTYCSEREENTK